MTYERWQQISGIYHVASRLAATDRVVFLQNACADDEGLRAEIESLLRDDSRAEHLLEEQGLRVDLIGRRIGVYEVTSRLDCGGMGEVYRARDTKLDRDVALKVLPAEFAIDPERLARFQREARLLASLNHPHIAMIYGVEDAPGTPALVLELVEGETLANRLAKGRLAIAEALAFASQIAEALEAAHEHGIVHRDLKPANIKVTPNGVVKVLDFGLAKTVRTPGGDVSGDPLGTRDGVVLGTVAYMSPEQARGKLVDKRCDIWAFGCVLYEMLAGRAAFASPTVSDTIAAIIEREPNWGVIQARASSRVVELLQLCLEKDVNHRRRDIGDVRLDIERAIAASSEIASAASLAPAWHGRRVAWTVAAVFAAIASLQMILTLIGARPPATEMRLQILTPPTSLATDFALSPDGNRIAFVGAQEGAERLWIRSLGAVEASPLPGTEGARLPFWSPDGRSIGFFASGKLLRIDTAGGPPQVLTNAQVGRGGTWNAGDVIVFAPSGISPLLRISASGGEPTPVTRLSDTAAPSGHHHPNFLPDGRHFIFFGWSGGEGSSIYLGNIDGSEPKRLLANDTPAMYLHPNRLVYVRQGVLVVTRVDVSRSEVIGDAEPLAESVAVDGTEPRAAFSVSATGRIAYRTASVQTALTWLDRSGTTLAVDNNPSAGSFPELSPAGDKLTFQRSADGQADVWVADLVRGIQTKKTFHRGIDGGPIWSPDGSHIAYISNRTGFHDLYVMQPDRGGFEELVLKTRSFKWAQDWSRDGRWLLYEESGHDLEWNLMALAMKESERKIVPVANTAFDERHGQFSPDGRYVAYATNESGRFEVVVQSFPGAEQKLQLSTNGGIQPRWRPDSKELYFIAPDSMLTAVSIDTSSMTLRVGRPTQLFKTHIVGGGTQATYAKANYAVSRDGRFLINRTSEAARVSPITLILNWKPRTE